MNLGVPDCRALTDGANDAIRPAKRQDEFLGFPLVIQEWGDVAKG